MFFFHNHWNIFHFLLFMYSFSLNYTIFDKKITQFGAKIKTNVCFAKIVVLTLIFLKLNYLCPMRIKSWNIYKNLQLQNTFFSPFLIIQKKLHLMQNVMQWKKHYVKTHNKKEKHVSTAHFGHFENSTSCTNYNFYNYNNYQSINTHKYW
jgi:hypothetical protein